MKVIPPTFIVGHIRSGTTLLHQTLIKSLPKAVDIDDFDTFEGRLIWQRFGCQMGSPMTGAYCFVANKDHATPEIKKKIREYCSKRTGDEKHIVNKNPHLANKIDFVRTVFPEAKFIHIIREPFATVASVKLLFEASLNGENYWDIPFLQYWPEGDFPCWHSFPAVPGKNPRNLMHFWKRLFWLPAGREGKVEEYLRRLFCPPKLLPDALWHGNVDEFIRKYPDETRYYPGKGFARIPEAWVTINAYIQEQLRLIPSSQWITVSYDDLCSGPRDSVAKILGFMNLTDSDLMKVPEKFDVSRRNKWKKNLSEDEQRETEKILSQLRHKVETLQPLFLPDCSKITGA